MRKRVEESSVPLEKRASSASIVFFIPSAWWFFVWVWSPFYCVSYSSCYKKKIFYTPLSSHFIVGWITLIVCVCSDVNTSVNIRECVYVCSREGEISFRRGEILVWSFQWSEFLVWSWETLDRMSKKASESEYKDVLCDWIPVIGDWLIEGTKLFGLLSCRNSWCED